MDEQEGGVGRPDPAGARTYSDQTLAILKLVEDLADAAMSGTCTGVLVTSKTSDGQMAVAWSGMAPAEALGTAHLTVMTIGKRILA